jgi:translocon-associated protein subunit alpha
MILGNGAGSNLVAQAEDDVMDDNIEDVIEGEDDDEAKVETDDGTADIHPDMAATETDKEDEEEEPPMKPSPDADTYILFTKPSGTDFPAGDMVKFLVGFTNKGDKDFVVDSMDASFRYPQDYSFYIQNFTVARFDRVIEPSRQATFEYVFTPSETFNARPFGLTINLNYKDAEGNIFQDAVFNDTVQIVEPDEGLDGETFFLYVFLAAVAVLLLVGAQQLLSGFGKRRLSKPKPIEMGTQNKGDIDYEWLPKETLQEINKSPRRSPGKSPGRRRNAKRSSGGADD